MSRRSDPYGPITGLKAGALVALTVWYLGAVGMLAHLSNRAMVGSGLTLARLLYLLPFAVAGWVAARPRIVDGELRKPSLAQATVLAIVTAATATVLIVAVGGLVDLIGVRATRGVFVSVSPDLLDVLRWESSWFVGGLITAGAGVATAIAGAFVRVSEHPIVRSIMIGVSLVVLGGLLQRILPTAMRELNLETGWLYSVRHGGLTEVGALVLFLVGAGSDELRRRVPAPAGMGIKAPAGAKRIALGIGLLVIVAVLPQLFGSIISRALGTTAIFLLMGLGLNIVVGMAGLLDLGYVAFFAVGAYATALFTDANLVGALGDTTSPAFSLPLNFYIAIPLVILVAMIIGVMIGMPVLRLRGDYLAIVTLGFGEIARVLLTSDWLRGFVGGAQGVRDVTSASFLGFDFRDPQHFVYLATVFVAIGIFVSSRLQDSRTGRAWSAMREDEQVAEAMGVNTIRYKLLAFSMGAAVGCLSGALFAVQIGSLAPTSFRVLVSIQALALIILGGLGSVRGVIIGALVLVGIPEVLTEFDQFRLLLYGVVLMAMMILRPQGLLPPKRKGAAVDIKETGQDRWLKPQGGVEV
ncbi:MAG: branched-chain amino acid ABC transporter permease [Actinomycetota bacterium]